LDKNFWLQRWAEAQIGFHKDAVNPALEHAHPRLVAGRKTPGAILVPMCGKSLDMVWLADQGHDPVVGVELSATAISAFFDEQDIVPVRSPGSLPLYSAGSYRLYCGDFFDLPADALYSAGLAYDRGALVALPPATRERYAARLDDLLPADGRMLLITLEYDQDQMSGPPFSVGEPEVRHLYADQFHIDRLGTNDVLDEEPRFKERGLTALVEAVYLLSRRG
jgi:thiopurine S-methyltransferase